MSVFRGFERKVVAILISPHMDAGQVSELLDSAIMVSYEYTVVGYFLTVKHPMLPTKRIVCCGQKVLDTSADVHCGFVLFLENHELMIDCHSFSDAGIPKDFRDQQVKIEASAW